MTALTQQQIETFWRDGVLIVEDAVTPEQLAGLRRDFAAWVEDSRTHDGAANRSDRPRTLFITVYAAADAIPLTPNPVPGRHNGRIVRGEEINRIRTSPFEMEVPEYPKGASFFVQQAGDTRPVRPPTVRHP